MTKQNPLVWIVIPTWNRKEDLLECLNSIKQVNYTPVRILVVDNASTDGTGDAVKKQYPNLKVIHLKENIGAPAASNIGFDHALDHGADYVLRLDSDTVVSPDFLIPMIELAEKQPEFGIISPKIYFYDKPERIWYAGVDAHPWHFGSINDRINKLDPEIDDHSREVDYAWGAAMLIRRDVLEKTGGFDPDFFIYYEEVDFCQRVQGLGFRIYYIAQSKIWHKVGTLKPSKWTAYNWNKSKMILFQKHAKNKFHLILLFFYAYFYVILGALINLIIKSNQKFNRGPLVYALKGLNAGYKK